MTVLSYLENLARNAILDDDEKSSIDTSINTLQKRLNNYFGNELQDHFIFGSYTRGTILPRKMDNDSDIDYMVIFEDDRYKPQTYLNKLKNFVEYYYSRSEIHQDNPAIVLELNHIKFELVPALSTYITDQYKIPDKANSYTDWIYTNPKEFNDKLTQKNINNNYQIKCMIRLVKYWNSKNEYPFASFELENHIVNKPYYISTNLKEYLYEYMSYFDATSTSPQWVKNKVQQAKNIINQVKEYENRNMPYSAENEIKKLLPEV